MTIPETVEALGPWYHSIELPGVTTPGRAYDEVWSNIRKSRDAVEYKGKNVLDIATFDGMWAFEAERLGAAYIVATDCNWEAHRRLLFCRDSLKSNVIPLINVPVHELVKRLDSYLGGWFVKWHRDNKATWPIPPFDIVQHLGLFYHLRDPMQSLLQCRSVIKDGGILLIETAFLQHEDRPMMIFNRPESWDVYDDITTWWAPSVSCLVSMLKASCFEFVSSSVMETQDRIGRICVVAKATPFSEVDPILMSELKNTYRTPGLE